MTIDEFFLDTDGECRHIMVPGATEDILANHIIFRRYRDSDLIKLGRQQDHLSATGFITVQDMEDFLEMKIGITDLWKRAKRFGAFVHGRWKKDIDDKVLKLLISPEIIK